MKRALQGISRVFAAFGAILLALLLIDVITGIMDRYVLHLSLFWTGEMARYLLIWASLTGATVLVDQGKHLRLELIDSLAPSPWKEIIRLFSLALCLIFLLCFTLYGIVLVLGTWQQASPALQIPMGVVYLAAPFNGFFMLLFVLRDVVAEFSALLRLAPSEK